MMRIKTPKLFIFLFLCIPYISFCQDSIIAEIGPIKLTSDEFKDRFELTPQLNTSHDRLEKVKQNFLYSLIAEKLWALQAEDSGIDTSEIMRTTYKAVEKMYVRDALYNIEIKSKVKINPDELTEGILRSTFKLNLYVTASEQKAEIVDIYNLLQKGYSFDSLTVIGKIKAAPVDVVYGQLFKPVEDIVYNLNEGEYSKPVEANKGWMIFYLVKKERISSQGLEAAKIKVEKTLRDEAEDSLYYRFMNSFFTDKKITANRNLFRLLGEKIIEILAKKKAVENIAAGEVLNFEGDDLNKLRALLGKDTLKLPFINFKVEPLSVEDFIEYFNFEPLSTDSADLKIILSKLNFKIKTVIEQELLAREGYKRGLQNLPQIKTSLKMWRESYLAKILQTKMADSSRVTAKQVEDYYSHVNVSGGSGITLVNIIEVLTDSLEIVEKFLNELKEGIDFNQLAAKYNKLESTKKKNDESGFIPETELGEIGVIAAQMDSGDVYGPVKVPEGYSIFKLVGKRDGSKDTLKSFAEVKDDLIKQLTYNNLQANLLDYTIKLVKKYGVKINKALFDNLQLNDWKMLAFRYMGFGGRITAVPLVFPFYEWSEDLKENDMDIQ